MTARTPKFPDPESHPPKHHSDMPLFLKTSPCSFAKLLSLLLLLILPLTLFADELQPDFGLWLAELRKEAAKQGVSQSTLDSALSDLKPIERIIELDRRQPEFTQTFWNYFNTRVTPERILKGRRMLEEHRLLLHQIEERYGVPARYLVAFWGLETNFGSYMGKMPTIGSLATLAFDRRRSRFFRIQLLDALRILDQEKIPLTQMKGSWAGAVGHLQFMPSTFLKHAVDADGDNRRDLWNSLPDAFASGGNYLNNMDWKRGELWGREVKLPEGFDWSLAKLKTKATISKWAALGVTKADGRPLPTLETLAAIILPQGHKGPAFMVYDNFEIILRWNRSIYYAIAVGSLADQLIKLPAIRHGFTADNRQMSRSQAIELQQQLVKLKHYSGEIDGILGSGTRAAVSDYQKENGLPADGYPSVSLLEQLQKITE